MLADELVVLRHRAELLRRVASRLRLLDLEAVRRLADDRTWRGPAATLFAMRVAAHRRALDECAEALAERARRWDSIG